MGKHNDLGNEGEKIARKYLENKGYIIYFSNYRLGHLEVDIIAEDGKELVFIEVKTRTSAIYGTPESAVDQKKEEALVTIADHYIREIELDIAVRFDIIGIVLNEKKVEINHILDAFSGYEHQY